MTHGEMILIFSIALVVILFGCDYPADTPPVISGQVIAREYHPAHWEGKYVVDCGTCPRTYVDHHDEVPDRWRLQLSDCVTDNKCRTGWITVNLDDYNRFTVGKNYP